MNAIEFKKLQNLIKVTEKQQLMNPCKITANCLVEYNRISNEFLLGQLQSIQTIQELLKNVA